MSSRGCRPEGTTPTGGLEEKQVIEMSNKEKNATEGTPHTDDESLPAMAGRLGEHIVTLLDAKLTLLKLEIKEDITGYARSGLSIGVGGLLVVVGFALLNIAFAF